MSWCSQQALLKERFLKWWNRPINPVFLTIKDEDLQNMFQENLQKNMVDRLKRVIIVLWVYLCAIFLINVGSLEEKLLFFTVFT